MRKHLGSERASTRAVRGLATLAIGGVLVGVSLEQDADAAEVTRVAREVVEGDVLDHH